MPSDQNKASALAGLNCLNNLLRGARADLHDATVVIEAAVRRRAARG